MMLGFLSNLHLVTQKPSSVCLPLSAALGTTGRTEPELYSLWLFAFSDGRGKGKSVQKKVCDAA